VLPVNGDIVSKNGNLLINVVQTPEGDLEPEVINILVGIGNWIKVNGETIYASRPWKVYGEGPTTVQKQEKGTFGGVKDVRKYQPTDIRYTTKNGDLYAFCMDIPTEDIQLQSLGKLSKLCTQKISSVTMLGSKQKLEWKQENEALVVKKPVNMPDYKVIAFQIKF